MEEGQLLTLMHNVISLATEILEACGGILHMSVYSEHGPVVIPPPSVKLVTEPGWTYQGCYKDTDSRVFPDFVRYYGTITEPKFCINRCAEASYEAAGLEFGSECWCGTLDQFESAEQAAEGDCWSICQGDQASFCGGPNRLTVYTKG
ncbi:hypothetical protein DL96DRAFT_190297 [Flagelloscypha sp. PMI_526]|nr:hypothetical protein DL96DRAFT_190297 [Flagelloscypha sp. PMI_526]